MSNQRGIPLRFESTLLDDIVPNDGNQAALQFANHWVDKFPVSWAATFVGDPGVGKTMLACAMVNSAGKQIDSQFVSTVDYIEAHHKQMQLASIIDKLRSLEDDQPELTEWRTRKERIWRYRNDVQVLILDDLGREHITASHWGEDLLEQLIRHRGDKGLCTVITSNLNRKERESRYGSAFESYLHEIGEIIPITGEDHRRAR